MSPPPTEPPLPDNPGLPETCRPGDGEHFGVNSDAGHRRVTPGAVTGQLTGVFLLTRLVP